MFVAICFVMEYTFISRDTFNGIIERYIGNLPTSKQEKALINLNFLNKIKEVLLDPKNNTISNKNTRSWIKKKFKLEEITPGNYRVIVAANNNPVLAVENMYEVLCRTHAEITQHGGQRQTWKSIIERWVWIKQDIVEQFVNNCTICAVRKPSFHPLAAKPIIARNFLSRVQMDLIDLSFDADGEYKYICHALLQLFYIMIINGRPRHPQSQGLVERANGILQQKLAMNNSWCRSHKKTPYELVYGDKPRGNCTLIDELFAKNIYNEEDIPDTIQIYDSIEDLDSDIIDDLQESNIPVQQLDIERAVVQDQDNENNRHIVLIDPVLLDITNNTQHEVLRNMARQDLQDYTNKMANQMSKGRKRIKEYQIGDL
ncbi:SCAN domain-containing protein 3-like [Rhizophagus irregularis DAOM 181602=DAOM 197198]|nr:SCAN domain-containing protein 3-like [Rhizophagus irregularis DAOM 181602=DAOM 197198]